MDAISGVRANAAAGLKQAFGAASEALDHNALPDTSSVKVPTVTPPSVNVPAKGSVSTVC